MSLSIKIARGDYRGDPFLGPLLKIGASKLLPAAGKLIGKVLGKTPKAVLRAATSPAAIATATGGAAAAVGTAAARRAMPTLPMPTWVGGGRGFDVLPRETGGGRWPTYKDGRPRRMRRDGKPYKRPSMNPMNYRAAMRASRRLEKGEKLLRRIYSIRHGGRAGSIVPKRKARGR